MKLNLILKIHNIESFSFSHYYKGHSQLGSLVESLVKQCKHFIFKSIRKNVLTFTDFAFLINKTIHLINRRLIAFKYNLQSSNLMDELDVSSPITPELLLRGYYLPSVILTYSYLPKKRTELYLKKYFKS